MKCIYPIESMLSEIRLFFHCLAFCKEQLFIVGFVAKQCIVAWARDFRTLPPLNRAGRNAVDF